MRRKKTPQVWEAPSTLKTGNSHALGRKVPRRRRRPSRRRVARVVARDARVYARRREARWHAQGIVLSIGSVVAWGMSCIRANQLNMYSEHAEGKGYTLLGSLLHAAPAAH
jgi:hypothetical protein